MPVAERLPIADFPDRPRTVVVESFPTRWWRRHAYILPSFLICIVTWSWFVTWGDWKFFEPEDFCGFYDALARSILHGHLDVPRDAIGVEAFTFEGKTYGYFGIGPALLRIPLVLIFPHMDGLWSRLMILIAATISLICAYRVMRMIRLDAVANTRVQRVLDSLFILSAGVGSTTVFLVGHSYTYHEASAYLEWRISPPLHLHNFPLFQSAARQPGRPGRRVCIYVVPLPADGRRRCVARDGCAGSSPNLARHR